MGANIQRIFLFITVCFLFSYSPIKINAQSQSLVDSLLYEIKASSSDSVQIQLFLHLANLHKRKQPVVCIQYAEQALNLALQTDNYQLITSIRRYMGATMANMGQVDEAFSMLNKALEIAEREQLNEQIPRCLNNLSVVHNIRGDWVEALKCLNKALAILEKSNGNNRIYIEVLTNIGVLFADQKNYKKATSYHKQALEITKKGGDSLAISITLTNIGEMLYQQGEKEKALIRYNEALIVSKGIDDMYGIGYLYTNMGIVYFEDGKIEIAEDYFAKAMKVITKINAAHEKLRLYEVLAKIEQKKENYNQSNNYGKKGLLIAKELKSKTYSKKLYETMARNYELQRNYKAAYQYAYLLKTVNDSLFNVEKSRQISELSIQYETKEKATENKLLKEQQAKNEALLQQRRILNWTIFLFLILVSVIAYFLFKNNRIKAKYNKLLEKKVEERTAELKNANAKLKRANSDLEQFAFITSHDLKEPLRNIGSFTSLVIRKLGDSIDNTAQEYLSIIKSNVVQMNDLIESVLNYARIKKIAYKDEDVDLNKAVDKLNDVLKNIIKKSNAKVSATHLPTVRANAQQMFIVLKNLVENAIKYNASAQPTIVISSQIVDKYYHIEVKDNGIGVDQAFQEKVFIMFKRLHNRATYNGVGIGLSICKKIIQQTGGEIWIKSEEGKGSRFIFSIPIEKEIQKAENE